MGREPSAYASSLSDSTIGRQGTRFRPFFHPDRIFGNDNTYCCFAD